MPNIKGLAQTVLIDVRGDAADAADTAETNWKHKVTSDRGDLNIKLQVIRYVDGTPRSEDTPVIIRYIRPPHHGHTSQYHGH